MTLARVFPSLLVLALMASPAMAADPPMLVTVEWLSRQLERPELRIIDMSTEYQSYRTGHVAGAVYLNVDDARIEVPAGGYRLPSAEEATRLFSALGIGPDTTVVIYDDAGGLHAARLFFTLEAFGHERVAIVDGGRQRWQAAGLAWEQHSVKGRTAPGYTARLRTDRVATAETIKSRLTATDIVLVDARSSEEYAGKDVRAKRGGHIPGAVSVDWRRNLNRDGTFKPVEELRRMYATEGVTPDKTVVTYCQTQHRASHTYFVLRLLGYPRVAGYDRSWSEWGNRTDLPIAR